MEETARAKTQRLKGGIWGKKTGRRKKDEVKEAVSRWETEGGRVSPRVPGRGREKARNQAW